MNRSADGLVPRRRINGLVKVAHRWLNFLKRSLVLPQLSGAFSREIPRLRSCEMSLRTVQSQFPCSQGGGPRLTVLDEILFRDPPTRCGPLSGCNTGLSRFSVERFVLYSRTRRSLSAVPSLSSSSSPPSCSLSSCPILPHCPRPPVFLSFLPYPLKDRCLFSPLVSILLATPHNCRLFSPFLPFSDHLLPFRAIKSASRRFLRETCPGCARISCKISASLA